MARRQSPLASPSERVPVPRSSGPFGGTLRVGATRIAVPLVLVIVGVFVMVYLQSAPSRNAEQGDVPAPANSPDQPGAASVTQSKPGSTDTGSDAAPVSAAPADAGDRPRAERIDNRAESDTGVAPRRPANPDRYGPNYPQNRTAVQMGGETFQLEVAYTNRDRYFGLSGRESIDTNGGMLFAFRRAGVRQFVMRHCLVPIDIVFMRSDGTVVQTYTMPIEPRFPGETDAQYERRLTRYSSIEPVELVAEFKAGTLTRLGVKPGDVISGQYALFMSLAEDIPDISQSSPN